MLNQKEKELKKKLFTQTEHNKHPFQFSNSFLTHSLDCLLFEKESKSRRSVGWAVYCQGVQEYIA